MLLHHHHARETPRQGRHRRWQANMRLGGLVVAALVGALVTTRPVHAANFSCPAGDVACLIAAITTANANGEENTITLAAGTYTLTTVDNTTDGPNGLPSVTSALTITGAGAETTSLEQQVSAPGVRLLHIGATGTLTLQGLTLRGGRSVETLISQGGGLFNHGGTLTLINSTLIGNVSVNGGGLANSGTATLTNSTVSDNQVGFGGGGGIFNSGTLTLTNTIISDNFSKLFCGGLANSGLVTLSHSTLRENIVVPIGGAGQGGGLCNDGTLTITNSTLAYNGAFYGGGIFNSGTLTLTNSTLAYNAANVFSCGGIVNSGTLTLTNSTVSGNAAWLDGGGLCGPATMQNTLLALNTTQFGVGADCTGPVTSLGTNLIGDPTGCTITLHPSDLRGDPGLGPFTDDGTPGNGHFPLLPTSQAIDAGNDAACPPTDQLGQPRVGRCDIGAIEFQAATDTTPPAITVSATPETLWPPNGKLAPVTISGTITDNEPGGTGVNASTAAYAMTDEYGRIQPSGPITLGSNGSYSFVIQLQASRNGDDLDGRQYIITVSAQDNAGNKGSAATGVTVPHDQGH